jgi:ketosteroid isomerase-like protein
MATNEEIVRAAYRTAEGDVLDLEGWRNAFTEDGVFNNVAVGESHSGDRLGDVVTYMANLLPDVHRELLRVHEAGDNLVVVELLIQGTFRGPLATPAGPVAPTGARLSIPTADFFYLRDGKIETFNCYVSMNIMLAQMGVYPDFASAVQSSAAVG